MALHLVYRSYGGSNKKGRPDYFDKITCLASFIRAAREVDAHVVFVNNGPIAEEQSRLMRPAGEIVELPGVGVHESYLSALRLATHGTWADDDIVYFSEDDYLYRADALAALVDATAAVPEADYFGLYGSNPLRPHPRPDPPVHRPRGWVDMPPWHVGGREWVRLYSTTATFAARVGALREDLGIFRFCTVPHRNMFRDHDTCLLYQGFEPHPYGRIARDLVGLAPGTPKQRLREAFMAPFMVATNLRSHRRRDRRRILIAPEPNLATHVENGYIAPGEDWAAVAAEVRDWARLQPIDPAGA